jgi:hypothetical protein
MVLVPPAYVTCFPPRKKVPLDMATVIPDDGETLTPPPDVPITTPVLGVVKFVDVRVI